MEKQKNRKTIENSHPLKIEALFDAYEKQVSTRPTKCEGEGFYFCLIELNRFVASALESLPKKLSLEQKEKFGLALASVRSFPETDGYSDSDPENIRYQPAVLKNIDHIAITSLSHLVDLLSSLGTNQGLLKKLQMELSGIQMVSARNQKVLSEKPRILTDKNRTRKTSPTPSLSIICASFNLGRFLNETLDSISNQLGDDFEILVIDGASKDNTLEILKQHPNVKWVSEKDHGYPEAFRKGLRMAKGKYILQCAVSDALASPSWVKRCIETLDKNPDVGLVWGFPQRLSESGMPGNVSYPHFYHRRAPERKEFFLYWLTTSFFFPEGNLCARKSVVDACYPQWQTLKKTELDWLEFNYNFHTKGYLSLHIPIIANYGRTHDGQMGQSLSKTKMIRRMHRNYLRKVRSYRFRVLAGLEKPKNMPAGFDRIKFLKEHITHSAKKFAESKKHYVQPKRYVEFLKKKTKTWI